MINGIKTNMNYLRNRICKLSMPDVRRMEAIVSELNGGTMEAVPLYNKNSEKQQEIRDLAEKLFAEKIKPVNMTGDVLVEAVTWASNHMDSVLAKLSESLESPNAGGDVAADRLRVLVVGVRKRGEITTGGFRVKKNDGGPAYPNEGFNGWGEPDKGMSLRDWFAGMALQGFLMHGGGKDGTVEEYAADAFSYADAMLSERDKD